ncbi:MAG: saccharopine dehydrogenase NADP-binding domain-containing protein [Bacteroidetes bacterium]|nr:saccharopine dehydrogenase NADP-binding domain-containing protein [Bacteroidota bacterium]
MTNILVFGAGKSSSYLIKYLLEYSSKHFWQVTVADSNINAALERIANHPFGNAVQIDIHEDILRKRLISNSNIVISLLPPALHIIVAKDCIDLRKNLVTASYVSDEIKNLHLEARNNGLLFMNEIGLDPGIDHMSAMKIIHEVERLGGEIYSFKSYCGGLVSPASDTNPWHYKISWNPNNIVNAGKSGADFLVSGFEEHLEYKSLFQKIEHIAVPRIGKLAAYANRDSLSYRSMYHLNNVKTMLRATLRHPEFCIGWHVIVNLGLTNDTVLYPTDNSTYKAWFMEATKHIEGATAKEKIKTIYANDALAENLLEWLGIFSEETIKIKTEASSAQILLARIEEKWKMEDSDKDMIVMQHEFEYGRRNLDAKLISTLVVEGEDKTYTAMAKTVGLPMAIFTKLFLNGKIKNLLGVQIPIMKEVYKPILKELTEYGIEFDESYNI